MFGPDGVDGDGGVAAAAVGWDDGDSLPWTFEQTLPALI